MNVAQAMVQAFVQEGVALATGIGGMSIFEFANAICSNRAIRVCYTRHERGAADLADGYARITGEPAVIFADAGPGVANNMAGILNSFGDSTPVIFVASQPDRFSLGWRSYKELPIRDVFTPVSKWTACISDPGQVAPIIRRAFMLLRSGRPGPVIIELPEDVASMPVDGFHYEPLRVRTRVAGDPAQIEQAVRVLGSAKRPYLFAGSGVLISLASEELLEFAELLTLPVATTLNGKSGFPENHPLSLGLGGFPRGIYGTWHATQWAKQADVVLTIGCSFQPPATSEEFPGDCKMIQIDVDAAEIHKKRRADIAILGDAKLVLQQMIAAAKTLLPASRLAGRADVIQAATQGRADWLAFCKPVLTSDERPINPFRVTWEFNRLVDPTQTIVLHDAGGTRGAIAQHYVATKPRSFVGFGVQSSMGWSIGAAIGAKLAAPDKLVVSFIGDQAFGETAMELETSVRAKAPILIVLLNNRGVPDERSILPGAAMTHGCYPGGDYCALARALGCEAMRIEQPAELASGLTSAIEAVRNGQTTLVEVITKRFDPKLYP